MPRGGRSPSKSAKVAGRLISPSEIRQAGGKTVVANAAERDLDPKSIVGNTIEIDWPPRSDRRLTIPQIDEARWFDSDDAHRHILPSQDRCSIASQRSWTIRPVGALSDEERGENDDQAQH